MKRLVFSICMLVATAAICVTLNLFFNETAHDFSKTAQAYAQQAKEGETEFYGEKLEQLWTKRRAFISLFVPTEIYEEADWEICRIKYARSLEEFKILCKNSAELVKKAEEDLPSMENIF